MSLSISLYPSRLKNVTTQQAEESKSSISPPSAFRCSCFDQNRDSAVGLTILNSLATEPRQRKCRVALKAEMLVFLSHHRSLIGRRSATSKINLKLGVSTMVDRDKDDSV